MVSVFTDSGDLIWPSCGFDYLHHDKIGGCDTKPVLSIGHTKVAPALSLSDSLTSHRVCLYV